MIRLKVFTSLFWCYLIFTFSLAHTNSQEVPFDLKEVMEKVAHHPTRSKNQVRFQDEGAFHRTDERVIKTHSRHNEMKSKYERTILEKRRHRLPNSRIPGTLQGEFLIDTTRICGAPAPDEQCSPSVAFDGTNYFVVWGDYHLGAVVGTRVTQNGEVLDTSGIMIAEAYGMWEENGPAIAFGNGNYFVIWEDEIYANIFGVRVNTMGAILDTTPIVICSSYFYHYQPSVTFGGSNYFVAWTEERADYDIYGARVSPDGVVLDPASIPICWAYNDQIKPAVIFGEDDYLVVWEDYRGDYCDIYGSRVNTAGQVLDPAGIPISIADNDQFYPALTFDGNNYFVVWEDCRNGFDLDIFGARVTQTGTVLDSTGIVISTAFENQYSPSVSFDGTNYFAVWEDERAGYAIYGVRIDTAGMVLDTSGICVITSENENSFPFVAFGSANYLVAWTDFRTDGDIYSARVDTQGTVLDPNGFLLTMQINSQHEPKIAFDGTNYLVVWADDRNGSDDIYGSRVSPAGIILDPGGIPISTANFTQSPCQIIFSGNQYFVIWIDNRAGNSDIYGSRISTDGIVLDTAGIPISTATDEQNNPQVVFEGDNYFVVWEDWRNGAPDIYGARITLEGEVLEPDGIPISTATDGQYSPQVTFGGNTYFVVWEDWRNNYNDIYGARVTLDGDVLEPDGIPISTAIYDQLSPQVTFGGNTYFVVWEDSRNNNYYDIYCSRITVAGVVLEPDGIPISIDTADYQSSPQVILSGNDYFVVWEVESIGSFEYDIYGARVNQAGVVIDSFAVSNQPGSQYYPALACGNGNQVLITYQGWTDEYQGMTYNTYRIWGKFYPFVTGISEDNSKVTLQSAKLFEVYPNPARSFLAIHLPQSADRQKLKIFDVSGKLEKEIATPTARNDAMVKISLKGINPGIYFLRLGKETKKFLVVK